MGLRITPGNAAWSYGGFHRFRERLAAEEGITLRHMSGFGGALEWETASGQHITPLAPLLNHSDCDGYLEPYEAEEILLRLPQILAKWSESDDIEMRYDLEQGQELVEALRHCVEHGCAVAFG